MSEKIIEIKSIAKKFGLFEAVKDVSFHVNQGDVFGFLGPNGAGKSTLMSTLTGELPADAGGVQLLGRALADWPANARASRGGIAAVLDAGLPVCL